MIHSARDPRRRRRVDGEGPTARRPTGLLGAHRLASPSERPKDLPSYQDSTQTVKRYSSPSARPGKVASDPASGAVTQALPSRTIP